MDAKKLLEPLLAKHLPIGVRHLNNPIGERINSVIVSGRKPTRLAVKLSV
jgi:hypothetical protein